MTTPLYLDTETFCEVPIANGTHRYAESAEIIMWQWAVGDGPVIVRDGDENIDDLLALLADSQYEIVIHNSAFDRTVMRHNGITIPVNRIFDTMICAQAHSLPGALRLLCEVLRLPTDKAKDKEGKAWIQLFCKPQPKGRKLRRATRETHPIEWQRFREYGKLDIVAMREVYKKLPRWNYKIGHAEHDLWCLDQRINDRGVLMDLELAHSAIRACARAQEIHGADVARLTDGAVQTTGQRDKMLGFILEAHGVLLPDLTGSTLKRLVNDPDLPAELRELLAVRLQSSKTSVSKYKRVINGVSPDGRLRGLLAFCGAGRTGRWSGRLFQPQNLPGPTLKNDAIERGIEALKANAEDLI
jgi:DNA polymerase